MHVMWTPWRMEFILSNKTEGCIFCAKPAEHRDRENYILYRGSRAFIMLNAYPYSNGHLLIAPFEHSPSLELLPDETTAEMMQLARRGIAALRIAFKPDGLNLGANIGAMAGAGIAEHVHLHVVPRWAGDTNFMPVVGNVRLVPETLETSFDRLIDAGIAEG
jgi:ATP adenylyltransferase